MAHITSSFHPRQAHAAPTATPHAPLVPDAIRLFDDWNQALHSGNPDAIVQLYCPEAVLLPTADDDVRVGHARIRDYFVHFMAGAPQGRILERHTQTGWDMLVDMGSYAFRFADGRDVVARYTFVYRPVAGRWRITHHHSSAMPEQYCGF
jgi:uncharacterized protein (TIGR02246 family)